jgi:hypothetical protein
MMNAPSESLDSIASDALNDADMMANSHANVLM